MQDQRRRIRLALAQARDLSHLESLIRAELGDDFDRIDQAFIAEGTRFVTVILKRVGPMMVEGVGWSQPLE